MSEINRREFLSICGAAPLALRLRATDGIRPGYAAITWQGRDDAAIREISEVGFKALQLRATAFDAYGGRPAELRRLLAERTLAFAVLSSGNLKIDPAVESEQLALHLSHARFLRDAGGQFLQVIDEKPKDRTPGPAEYKRLGALMSELGRRTKAMGVPLVYHHHMKSIGEPPEAIDAILAASDPDYVGLLFDIAHYQQGGGDPVAAIRRYKDRIRVVHLKDVRAIDAAPGYQWVELGRGRVDVKGCVAALRDIGFAGWAIVELDRVVDEGETAKAAAEKNRDYVVRQLGLAL
jgi:inosose dehydratase